MKFERLSPETREGLRRWAQYQHDDELLWDDLGGDPAQWAWLCFQLRAAEDKPEWFPKGKWATLQVIEGWIYDEASSQARRETPTRFTCPVCGCDKGEQVEDDSPTGVTSPDGGVERRYAFGWRCWGCGEIYET